MRFALTPSVGAEGRRFRDRAHALDFLRRAGIAPDDLAEIRRLLARARPHLSLDRMDDPALLETIAAMIGLEELHIDGASGLEIRGPASRPDDGGKKSDDSGGDIPIVPPKKKEPKESFARFQVIDDATGAPYSGVNLEILDPTGVTHPLKTDKKGMVEVKCKKSGKYAVSSDIKRAKLTETFDFVRIEEGTPVEPPEGDAEPHEETRIAVIDVHKVKKGESIESLAIGINMTWQDLSFFNWGTDVPNVIHVHLRDDVGCTKRAPDGYNYRFDDSDDPGLMYLPRPWGKVGLPPDLTYLIRVLRVTKVTTVPIRLDDPVLGFLSEIPVKVTYPEGPDEEVTTDAEGVAEVKRQFGRWVDLEFDTEHRPHKMRVFISLDPPDTKTGAWQRLCNMGFVDEEAPGLAPQTNDDIAVALEELQVDYGLEITGDLDAASIKVLTEYDSDEEPWGARVREELEDPENAQFGENPKERVT